mgnify:CR=1 FL=1|tara:strand:- start:1410 stop:1898 length:489 start_codon:yes stop_codon:yes gene_type:complete
MLPKSHMILMFVLPFANEIANALTISKVGPFKRLYKPCGGDGDSFRASFIDMIALFGIIWNSSYMASKHGTQAGCIYGLIILLLSFIIPNLFMEKYTNYFCKEEIELIEQKDIKTKCSVTIKFIVSISFICILLFIEVLSSYFLKKVKWKYSPARSSSRIKK